MVVPTNPAMRIVLAATVAFAADLLPEGTCISEVECDSYSLIQVTQSVSVRNQAAASEAKSPPPIVSPSAPRKLETQELDLVDTLQHFMMDTWTKVGNKTDIPDEDHLTSRDPVETNLFAVFMLFGAIILSISGACCSTSGSTFPAWMVTSLLVCYAMWCVGILGTNSNMLMVIKTQQGEEVIATRDTTSDPPSPGVMHESPWAMISLFLASPIAERRICGILCLVCAILGPAMRLGSLFLGQLFRNDPSTDKWARRFLLFVKIGSKWASAVFLLMIMIHCQFLAMDNGDTVRTRSSLDLGWMAFFLFCVLNIVIALSVVPPELDDQDTHDLETPLPISQHLVLAVLAAGSCYILLLASGIFSGAFSYNLHLAPVLWATLDPSVHDGIIGTEVSVWKCTMLMFGRFFHSGQVMPLLAALILGVFVIILPLVDIIALMVLCYHASEEQPKVERVTFALNISRLVRWVLLSDVFCFAFYIMSTSGMFVMHGAVFALTFAEIIRYGITYSVVESGVGIANYLQRAKAFSARHPVLKYEPTSPQNLKWEAGRWKVEKQHSSSGRLAPAQVRWDGDSASFHFDGN